MSTRGGPPGNPREQHALGEDDWRGSQGQRKANSSTYAHSSTNDQMKMVETQEIMAKALLLAPPVDSRDAMMLSGEGLYSGRLLRMQTSAWRWLSSRHRCSVFPSADPPLLCGLG